MIRGIKRVCTYKGLQPQGSDCWLNFCLFRFYCCFRRSLATSASGSKIGFCRCKPQRNPVSEEYDNPISDLPIILSESVAHVPSPRIADFSSKWNPLTLPLVVQRSRLRGGRHLISPRSPRPATLASAPSLEPDRLTRGPACPPRKARDPTGTGLPENGVALIENGLSAICALSINRGQP